MIVAFDIHYDRKPAKGVAIVFNWIDEKPVSSIELFFDEVQEYVSGEFYKRELPCILKLCEKLDLSKIDVLIVDGNVWANNEKKPGLGMHLYKSLSEKIPVIGVAKNFLKGTDEVCKPVFRGSSKKPLWISTVGFPVEEAIFHIQQMKGSNRIPTLLKTLDQLTRV